MKGAPWLINTPLPFKRSNNDNLRRYYFLLMQKRFGCAASILFLC